MSIASTLMKLLREWLEKRAFQKRKEQVLSKYGWDCTCPACKKLMHTEDTVVGFQETDNHWHYLCKCGFISSWWLGAPCPMYDSSFSTLLLPPFEPKQ